MLSESGSSVGGLWGRGIRARSGTGPHRRLSDKKRIVVSYDIGLPLGSIYPGGSSERCDFVGEGDVRRYDYEENHSSQKIVGSKFIESGFHATEIEKNGPSAFGCDLDVSGTGSISPRSNNFLNLIERNLTLVRAAIQNLL